MNKIFSVTMPDIGEGVIEGEIVQWLKKEGDLLKLDEPVVVVMTDKATVELPSPYSGKLLRQHYKVGEIAIKGRTLYEIEMPASASPQSIPEKASAIPTKKIEEPQIGVKAGCSGLGKPGRGDGARDDAAPAKEEIKKTILSVSSPSSGKKALATPQIRKLARDLKVDIDKIPGSGKEGRVVAEDLVSYQSSLKKEQKNNGSTRAKLDIQSCTPVLHWDDDEETPIVGLRNRIAEKMVESKLIIPHFSYFDQMDATALVEAKEKMRTEAEKLGIKLTFTPFFIKALSLALLKFPSINGSVDFEKNTMIVHKHHNVGFAIKTPSGLMVPTIRDVQNLSLNEIIDRFNRLKKKALDGTIEAKELKDSTITITNFGVFGGLWATPIINYPEAAILGIGRIRKMPYIKNNALVACDVLNLSWSFDHRIIDGDAAAEFSNYFIHLLENPNLLM